MNVSELRDFLDSEIAGFPGRSSGEDGYRFLLRIIRRYVDSARQPLVEVMKEWLRLRAEPKTMLAVKLAADLQLGELRSEVEELLRDVESGVTAFNPALKGYYARRITDALSRI